MIKGLGFFIGPCLKTPPCFFFSRLRDACLPSVTVPVDYLKLLSPTPSEKPFPSTHPFFFSAIPFCLHDGTVVPCSDFFLSKIFPKVTPFLESDSNHLGASSLSSGTFPPKDKVKF